MRTISYGDKQLSLVANVTKTLTLKQTFVFEVQMRYGSFGRVKRNVTIRSTSFLNAKREVIEYFKKLHWIVENMLDISSDFTTI